MGWAEWLVCTFWAWDWHIVSRFFLKLIQRKETRRGNYFCIFEIVKCWIFSVFKSGQKMQIFGFPIFTLYKNSKIQKSKKCKNPKVQKSKSPKVQMSKSPKVQKAKNPKVQKSKNPKI